MILVKNIQTIRDMNGRILGYNLQDKQGNTMKMRSDELKSRIANNQISVINLKLTVDGRLITKTYDTENTGVSGCDISKDFIEFVLQQSMIEGCSEDYAIIFEQYNNGIKPERGSGSIVFSNNGVCIIVDIDKHLVRVIGHNFRLVQEAFNRVSLAGVKFKGNIKADTSLKSLFEYSHINRIDLSDIDTSGITDMSSMFSKAKVSEIKFRDAVDTRRLLRTDSMFKNATVDTLDISGFDTSNLNNTSSMFENANINKLDISNFNMGKVGDSTKMFLGAKVNKIKAKGLTKETKAMLKNALLSRAK